MKPIRNLNVFLTNTNMYVYECAFTNFTLGISIRYKLISLSSTYAKILDGNIYGNIYDIHITFMYGNGTALKQNKTNIARSLLCDIACNSSINNSVLNYFKKSVLAVTFLLLLFKSEFPTKPQQHQATHRRGVFS